MKHPNYDLPTSIIISGVESNRYWDIVVEQCQVKTVLMSYHYMKSKPSDFLVNRLKKYMYEDLVTGERKSEVNVFIDSGAHTFLQKADQYMNKDDKFWDDYLKGYTDWLRENKQYVFACANLDLEVLVGIDKVDEWNERYFKPLEEEGIQVCYIWHTPRGENGWEEMCKKHSYIGMSMENDADVTVQRVMRRLNVAKKYNTRVHGMALTKTEILVRVPFFSADSTTWLVGQQYGELNWFNGRKMERLSKNEWRRNYKTKLLKEPFNANWDLLINGMGGRGDTYELLRLNVIAFQLAEEHIRKRLHAKMYWLPDKSKEEEPIMLRDIEEIELPEKDWYNSEDCVGWEHYMKSLGIDPSNYTMDEAVNILYFFYMFLRDEEALDEIDDNTLITYAQQAVDSSIKSREKAIEALRDYYIKNATGERKDFIIEEVDGTSPKEREKYIEEDAFAIIDLSEEQVAEATSHLISPPKDNSMPEIEVYDKELKKQGIVAVRDEKGRFIKGQKAVRKPRNVYSTKYPKLNCDTCYKSGDCPQYKAGYVCAYDRMFKRFDSRNLEDVVESMQGMINFNMERLQRAMIFETLDGGMPTAEVTGLIDQNMRLMEKMKDLLDNSPKAILEQRRVLRADGTEESTTTMNVNPTSGGILSQIFGNQSKKDSKNDDIIDV